MLLGKDSSGTNFSRGLHHSKINNRSTSSIHGRPNVTSLRSSYGKHGKQSDSEETSGSEDESGSDESDSEESDDEVVDCKVTISHSDDVRGFSVSTSRGFTIIMKQLEDSYGSVPRLSYYDDEGDKISIIAESDFEYAVRAHKTMTSLERKSKKLGANKLTFVAEFGEPKLKSTSSKSSSLTSTINASNKTAVDNRLPRPYSCVDMPAPTSSTKSKKESNEVMWQRGELLGSGSFGQVYSGIDMSSGIRIAVKEVVLGIGKRYEQQALALLREIKILSELDHPNIIKYLGTEYSENTMRIFLELATEGSLKDALTAFGALAEPIIRRYTLDIVSGLAFLHSKRFIHRDIKPTNLLISNGVIKVADFGCSSSSFDPIAGYATSEMGHATVTGTTVYMAPEVMGVEDEAFNSKSGSNDSKESDVEPRRSNSSEAKDSSRRLGHDHTVERSAAVKPYPNVPTLPPVAASNAIHRKDYSFVNEYEDEFNKENGNDSGSSTMYMADRRKEETDSPIENVCPIKDKKHGYGRKADIWSLGITLCEMSTGKSPYRTAAAAIYNVCVSKKYPVFAENMSPEAHDFLSRCLVAEPRLRASCSELLSHPFLLPQTLSELRALSGPHTCSTVSYTPMESLPKGLKTIRKEMNSRSLARVAPCTAEHEASTMEATGKGSRYSTVGTSDSWLKGMETRGPSVLTAVKPRTSTGPIHREYKDIAKIDIIANNNILARVVPLNKVMGRPPRSDRK